jgi:HK97 family phage prohead protease
MNKQPDPKPLSRINLDSQTQTIDPANMLVRSIISTSAPDRAGDVVLPAGLRNRDEFLKNPVVLWAHQRTMPPIGICQTLDVQPDRIVAETKFSASSPLAADVFKLYAEGILRGWSIGFLPVKVVPTRTGLRIEEWDLLEYSAVPVPENPGALTMAVQKGMIHSPDLRRWLIRDVLVGLFAA